MPIAVGKDQSVFKRVTCRNCGTINEYAPGEVRNLWNGCDYSGGSDGADGFNCAHCGEEVITKRW